MTYDISIEFVKIPVSYTLSTHIERKLTKLNTHYPWVKSSRVYLKKAPENIDRTCICKIDLNIPGSRIFASSKRQYFEIAVKDTIRQLEQQLQKVKDKVSQKKTKSIQ